mgnify:FL=1
MFHSRARIVIGEGWYQPRPHSLNQTMKIAIYETNLLWSVRLKNAFEALGTQATVHGRADLPEPGTEIALLNLGDVHVVTKEFVDQLHSQRIVTIAHAGHKETELISRGKAVGCQLLVTNGALANNPSKILADAQRLLKTPGDTIPAEAQP